MAIHDANIQWLEKRVWLPAQAFQTYITGAGVAAGDPLFTEIGTSGITAGSVAAAADAWAHAWMTPYDLDIRKQMRFRVWWAQTSVTATDSISWVVTYQAVIEESTVIVSPATVLSTAIPLLDLSSGTAAQFQATGFGVINGAVLPDTTVFLNLNVAAPDIGTFSADEAKFVGLEVRYTPRRTFGAAGRHRNIWGGRRLLTDRPLGTLLHATQEGASL